MVLIVKAQARDKKIFCSQKGIYLEFQKSKIKKLASPIEATLDWFLKFCVYLQRISWAIQPSKNGANPNPESKVTALDIILVEDL